MTLAKKVFCLSSSLLLAGAMSVAQTAVGGSSQDQESSTAGQSAGAALRGCLSGSADNYTLTDHNGTIYHLMGGGDQLRDAVGHEVEVTGTPDSRRTGVSDDTAANTASSFEVMGVRDMGSRCDHGSSPTSDRPPMTEQPPKTDSHPKGAPGEGTPPEPHPELIALLQQPASPDSSSAASQTSNTSPTSSTSTSTTQTSPDVNSSGQQAGTGTGNGSAGTPPPVTSQTPATPQSPTDSNAQLGTGAASQTGTPAAGTNPTTGTENQPQAGATTAQQPNQNDQNKPLYERQATDVPWAQGGSAGNGAGTAAASTTTTTTTNPNGSSSTTTTTTPQPHL